PRDLPAFPTRRSSDLSFASTLAPFLRLEGFPRGIDYEALRDYLACQSTLAPHSFLSAVAQLPPASQLVWTARDGGLEVRRHWDRSEEHTSELQSLRHL